MIPHHLRPLFRKWLGWMSDKATRRQGEGRINFRYNVRCKDRNTGHIKQTSRVHRGGGVSSRSCPPYGRTVVPVPCVPTADGIKKLIHVLVTDTGYRYEVEGGGIRNVLHPYGPWTMPWPFLILTGILYTLYTYINSMDHNS